MNFTIQHEKEDDGRWLAEVPELPGVLAYGASAEEAMSKANQMGLLKTLYTAGLTLLFLPC